MKNNLDKDSKHGDFNSNDLQRGYVKRYETGSYQNRFFSVNAVLTEERKFIFEVVTKSCEVNEKNVDDEFVLLDFGGGGGRLFPVFCEIADYLKKSKINFKVICYDLVGLDEAYRKILEENGFQLNQFSVEQKENSNSEESSVKKVASYSGEGKNLKFDFFCGPKISYDDPIDELIKEIKEKLGEVDAAISVFGSISHIMGRENRQKIFGVINDITKGYFGATLPSKNVHVEDIKAYELVRSRHQDLKFEEGDATYIAEDNKPYPYHHYNEEKLRKDFEVAGFDNDNIRISPLSFLHPLEILKNPNLNYFDQAIIGTINNLPKSMKPSLDKVSSYFEVFAPSQQCLEKFNEEKKIPSSSINANDEETEPLLRKEKDNKCVIS